MRAYFLRRAKHLKKTYSASAGVQIPSASFFLVSMPLFVLSHARKCENDGDDDDDDYDDGYDDDDGDGDDDGGGGGNDDDDDDDNNNNNDDDHEDHGGR